MSAKEKHYRHEMLLLLDEFPALGRVPVFEKALGYIAGYGLRTLIIAQDRSQIIAHYGKNETIIPNCHIRVCFAPNELETAKWISDMTGVATVLAANAQISGKRAKTSIPLSNRDRGTNALGACAHPAGQGEVGGVGAALCTGLR
jgi:type IV secretion system protein VirD4